MSVDESGLGKGTVYHKPLKYGFVFHVLKIKLYMYRINSKIFAAVRPYVTELQMVVERFGRATGSGF